MHGSQSNESIRRSTFLTTSHNMHIFALPISVLVTTAENGQNSLEKLRWLFQKAALLMVEIIILFHETIGLCLVAKIKISPP